MRQLFILTIAILAFFAAGPVYGQSYTSFSKAVISFESEPSGANVFLRGECIGQTPCRVEVTPEYLLVCDAEGSESMDKSTIKAYNSTKMDIQMRESGQKDGQFSDFAMEFSFEMEGYPSGRKTLPLLWSPAKVLGMDGTRIYYPDSLVYRF